MTDDERLLRDLGRLERAQRPDGQASVPDFAEELCSDTMSEDEKERLRSQAEHSDDGQRALAIFEPLGKEFQARMVGELRTEVEPRTVPDDPGPVDLEYDPPSERALSWFPKETLRRPAWTYLAVAAGFAAMIIGLVRWLSPPEPTHVASLPPYILSRFGGIDDLRSPDSESAVPALAVGSTFLITLIPESRVTQPIAVKFFVVGAGRWRPWPVTAHIADTGAIRVEERLDGELALEPGPWTMIAAIGPPQILPSQIEAQARLESDETTRATPPWRLAQRDFRVVAADD